MNKQLKKMQRQVRQLQRRYDRGGISNEDATHEYMQIMGIDIDQIDNPNEEHIQAATDLLRKLANESSINSLNMALSLMEIAVKNLISAFDELNQALEIADTAMELLIGTEE